MIIHNQQNIKVHFAGAEDINLTELISSKAKVKYHLFTVYPFIRKGQKNDKDFIARLKNSCNHSIMDSGLFTLMFGSEKGKKSEEFLNIWFDKIIEFVKVTNYKGTCVEVDCQKVLGVKKAWEYRERMKDLLPNKQINVFHIEDGKNGLDRMIEFSDYIAISVPELRAIKKKEYLYKIFSYIKNKKPEIDIHLLGFTEFKNLAKYKSATSCDSVSWKQASMYGQYIQLDYKQGKVNRHYSLKKNVNKSIRINFQSLSNTQKDEILSFFRGKKLTEKSVENLGIDLLSAKEHKKVFEFFGGNQD